MSNKQWTNAKAENKSQEQQQQQQARDDEDEEFGEFEGFEGAGHFEPSMAQPLPQALQAGMSAWSTFPDYVPSQRTASSTLQPDLLPMQATSNMHSSQMTDSNSSLGEGVSFDLPDVSPQEPASSGQSLPGNAPPTSPPSVEGPVLACASGVRGHAATSHSPLALPDVSSREDQGRGSLPDVRANLTGGQHLQGARNRMSGGNAAAASAPEGGSSQPNGINGSPQSAYLEEQLSNSRILNQRLTTETEDLHQRVNDLEERLSRCRSHLHDPNGAEAVNVEAIVQSALQRQRSEFATEMQGLMSRLLRNFSSMNAAAAITEERFQALLLENNKRQLAAIEGRLETLAEGLNESVRSTVQKAIRNVPEGLAATSDLDEVLRKFANEQQKRDAEARAHILSCLQSVLASSQQQLKVLLQPPGPSKDS